MLPKTLTVISLSALLSFSCLQEGSKAKKAGQNEPAGGYELVWADEFEGGEINPENWSFEIWKAGRINNEWQQYVKNPHNYRVHDGMLYITATRTGRNEKGGYSSTRLTSKDKKEFLYGRIEFSARMPSGTGTWPALWMLGANIDETGWPGCGEIDIMEYVGFQADTVHSNIHNLYQSGETDFHMVVPLETAEEDFHVYGIVWSPDSINFYIDDPGNIVNVYAPETKTDENWPFNNHFFLIMNFAVGGNWGGRKGVDDTIWPQSMIVDYVRVYQLKE